MRDPLTRLITRWKRDRSLRRRDPATADLIAQVKAEKRAIAKLAKSTKEFPKLSLILQSFNHRENVSSIAQPLQGIRDSELIICEDGSIDGTLEAWLEVAKRPNDFLLRSNDLHEIRAYDRAIRMAHGEFVCILQDDDIPPDNDDWVAEALNLFAHHPDLAVLGGFQGKCFRSEGKLNETAPLPRRDGTLGIPFTFIDAVNVGPVFFKKSAWMEIGGFDFGYSKPGKPGIGFDYEICLRAWLRGFEVGLYSPPFKRRVGVQGSHAFATEERKIHHRRNEQRTLELYEQHFDDIGRRVDRSNERLDRVTQAEEPA